MEMTRRVMTNVETPSDHHAPMGQFYNAREYPNASFKDVTAPNADTLYSTAWLDLAKEPYIFSLPDESNRYYLMPMLSGWTDVFEVPGKRTTGTKAQKYAITGPGWKGKLPEGITEYKSPTSLVWILGRTYCNGNPLDYQAVHFVPGSVFPCSIEQLWKALHSTQRQSRSKNRYEDFGAGPSEWDGCGDLFQNSGSTDERQPASESGRTDGRENGEDRDRSWQGFRHQQTRSCGCERLAKCSEGRQEKIMGNFKDAGKDMNGWQFMTKTGIYGTEYLQRAFVTAIGLGANRPQDAVYPTSQVDGDGKPYDGANKYVMHFPKGQTPPAKGFWSLTMYNADYFFVANPLNKYTVSPRNALKNNDDGSLDIFIQKDSPGKDKEANWLPAPAGKFILMLRLYWPQETAPSIIDGTWQPPAVSKIK